MSAPGVPVLQNYSKTQGRQSNFNVEGAKIARMFKSFQLGVWRGGGGAVSPPVGPGQSP